jgi:prepilin-type N-terminal cleavage/methylation domain-containing protein
VKASARGFTIAEVLVAIMILSVGVLAIAASSGSVYRMLGYGRLSTEAAHLASTRLELLRRQANTTTPRCTSLANGVDTVTTGIIESWTVSGTGLSRSVVVVVHTPTNHGPAHDSIFSVLDCR